MVICCQEAASKRGRHLEDSEPVPVWKQPVIVGWDGIRREHGGLVHVEIIDGKFWIQRDGTEDSIARELLDAGVPRSRIVLAFRSLEKRRLTDCAVM